MEGSKDSHGKKETGNAGEDKAAFYLIKKGYEIIQRNYRTRRGEIDIIAKKEELLVFVEVKTLPNGNAELLSHVLDQRKQKRIIKTAKCFLAIHRQYSNDFIRFDVIVNDMPGFPEVYHIENAFAEFL
ncbi:MAG: YraN family protein [Treponema sp.]|nr:YraN family protein [Treponema sp.]